MSRSTLRSLIGDHYRSASLSEATVRRWIAAQQVNVTSDRRIRLVKISRRAMFAVLALAAVLTLLLLRAGTAGPSALARAIAADVASHHAKLRPLDVQAATFSELRRAMGQLEFTLVEPQHPSCVGLALDGARYCSILDRPAAQIRLRDARGEAFTLYQAREDSSLEGIPETKLVVSGSIVLLWHENGLFHALATAAR